MTRGRKGDQEPKKKDILSQDMPGEAHTGMQQESSMRMMT